MRIVSGKHKGRPLAAPKGQKTRPTSDRAREAIFNVLEHGIPGPGLRDAQVLDVFAGTGALGLEALSRGANHCTFIESNGGTKRILMENIQSLDEDANSRVLLTKASALGKSSKPCDYAFLDAPYNQGLSEPALIALADGGWLKDDCVVMVEIAREESLNLPPQFTLHKEKDYGAARVVFLIYSR